MHTPDLFDAQAQATAGMNRALAHANAATVHDVASAGYDAPVTWADLATAFLTRFARQHATFIANDVTSAAELWGMVQPPTTKAWGSIYKAAARDGIIRRIGYEPSPTRHCSPTPLWKSLICREA